jgi:hypothetical protein
MTPSGTTAHTLRRDDGVFGRGTLAALFVAVAIPVPLLALSGLRVPLPAFVERLTAALVAPVQAEPRPEAAMRLAILRTPSEIELAAAESAVVRSASSSRAPVASALARLKVETRHARMDTVSAPMGSAATTRAIATASKGAAPAVAADVDETPAQTDAGQPGPSGGGDGAGKDAGGSGGGGGNGNGGGGSDGGGSGGNGNGNGNGGGKDDTDKRNGNGGGKGDKDKGDGNGNGGGKDDTDAGNGDGNEGEPGNGNGGSDTGNGGGNDGGSGSTGTGGSGSGGGPGSSGEGGTSSGSGSGTDKVKTKDVDDPAAGGPGVEAA